MHLKQNFNIVFCSGLFYNRVSRACKSSPEKRIVYEVEKFATGVFAMAAVAAALILQAVHPLRQRLR